MVQEQSIVLRCSSKKDLNEGIEDYMTKNPLVTVLMAVYNGEKCVKHTIESILNQTFKDFEFLIVNDGSTDRTLDVIRSYKDERIIIHNNEINMGQTKSLNIGLRLACGKYLARIDAGDVSMPKRLERQVTYIENNPGITVFGTSAFRYNDSRKVIDVVHMPKSPFAMLQRIFFTSPLVHVSVLMNREKILHIGGYDENYEILADYELWSRLIQNNYRLANIREVLVGYMVSPESVGAKNLKGKSDIEAIKIIQSNVNKLTNLSISLEQATNLCKLFTHNMSEMSLNEIISTENLFINIFKCVNASKSDANWFLIRNHIKYVLQNIRKPTEKSIFQYTIKSIISKIGCLFTPKRFSDNLLQLYQSMLWRNMKTLPFKLFLP